jgi:hypothetical protein
VDGWRLPTLTLKEISNLAGDKVPVIQPPDASAIVLLFLNVECPIANRYAPEMRRLHTLFARQGVAFRLVYPGAHTSAEDIRRHVREFALPGEVLRDPELALARAAGVRVTPEAVVVLPNRLVAYRGRIDDQFADLGVKRPAPTRRDLEEALKEILAGQAVSCPRTTAVGCVLQSLP